MLTHARAEKMLFKQEHTHTHAEQRLRSSGAQGQQSAKDRKRLENQPGFWTLPSLPPTPTQAIQFYTIRNRQAYLLFQPQSFISWREAAGRLEVKHSGAKPFLPECSGKTELGCKY